MARQQARRRNRERLAGIIIACLGVVVLVVAAIALAAPGGNEQTASSRSTSAAATTPAGSSSSLPSSTSPASGTSSTKPGPSLSLGSSPSGAKRLPLLVLNNTSTNGLAIDAAKRFRSAGWTVSDTGNLSNEIVSTCAYYDPNVDGAEAAAKALRAQFPTIKRVVEKFPELPSGPIVVVLTSDYSAG